MLLPARIVNRPLTKLLSIALMSVSCAVLAQEPVVIGVIDDGPMSRLSYLREKYIDELRTLTANEFDIQVEYFSGDWNKASIEAALEQAYDDSRVDLVLVTGFVANQIAATRREFTKPTFLPLILDTGLLADDSAIGKSGVANLSYLSAYADFAGDLDALAKITPFRNLVLFVDVELSSAMPELREAAYSVSRDRGIELVFVTHDGSDHRLMDRVAADTDAIFVAGLPRMPADKFKELVDAINSAKIPSYSFLGVADVERGMLVTNTEPRDVDRQARLTALNIQAVLLGERAEDQPTAAGNREQLTINMATARLIGLSPSFAVLNEAVLLNQDAEVAGFQHGIVEIARMALEQNQDLQAEAFGVQAGLEEIARARSSLLPQIGASASNTTRKTSPTVAAGLFAEHSTDAAISLDQLIYSDAASANLKIQKAIQRQRLASLQQFRLDVVQVATTSYYTVLNARSQLAVQENNLKISRANLELAETRVRLGTSTPADVYRWQAEVARAQILVSNARAALNQSWDTLNRVLHRPHGTRIALKEASFDEPFIMRREEFDELVRNPADYARFSQFYIDRAVRQAPEIAQLNAQISAKRRELSSQKRAYWLPDFTLGGQYTSNLSQSGLGAGPGAGRDLNDWNFGIRATLPLFSGGLKKANVSRASFELRQLESLRISTEERVEEQIRLQLHEARAAYARIDLSIVAAQASRKNFELVSDAYARGTVSVIELLDAQDTSLVAAATAAESLYSFLITIMSVQRAVGGYDYLLTPEDRDALAAEFRRAITDTRR